MIKKILTDLDSKNTTLIFSELDIETEEKRNYYTQFKEQTVRNKTKDKFFTKLTHNSLPLSSIK